MGRRDDVRIQGKPRRERINAGVNTVGGHAGGHCYELGRHRAEQSQVVVAEGLPEAGFEPTRLFSQGILRQSVRGNEISKLLISLPCSFYMGSEEFDRFRASWTPRWTPASIDNVNKTTVWPNPGQTVGFTSGHRPTPLRGRARRAVSRRQPRVRRPPGLLTRRASRPSTERAQEEKDGLSPERQTNSSSWIEAA